MGSGNMGSGNRGSGNMGSSNMGSGDSEAQPLCEAQQLCCLVLPLGIERERERERESVMKSSPAPHALHPTP